MAEDPNILLIVCDQLAPQFTTPYGSTSSLTPNLDALARTGVTFEAAYTTCPLCAPARNSLMTGRYASNIDCFDNSSPLAADQPTVAHYFTNGGYETVLSGKMHFPGPDQLHGFSKRLTTDIYPSDFTWLPKRPKEGWNGYANVHAQPIAIDYVTAGPHQWSMQLDYDEETHFRALEYLRGRAKDYGRSRQKEQTSKESKPFFLCVSYSHPHEPFYPTWELWNRYEDREIPLPHIPEDTHQYEHPIDRILNDYHGTSRVDMTDEEAMYRMRRAYLAQISYIDDKVGELLLALSQCGLEDNTVVAFISDHGDMLGERGMVQKRCHYEFSARIPWLIRTPEGRGAFGRGTRVQEPVSLADLAPTFMELAGLDPPSSPMDGSSVLGLMQGKQEPDRTVYCESHAAGMTTTTFMARRGNLKYIHASGYGPQLYDLSCDPGEWVNLAGKESIASVEQELRTALLDTFDPEDIERRVEDSIARRRIIRAAMETSGGPNWDFQPFFDARNRYWRSG